MKNLPRLLLIAGLAGFTSAYAETAAPAVATAAAVVSPKPEIGGVAPAFNPTAWVHGEPVSGYEAGKVYVIECWATWCGPCVAMIPHLNELHKKYADKGLVVIGTNVWDKTKEHAEAFVKEKGAAMSYRVAFDDKETGAVTRDWLKAAGVRGIPHAFVVRDGKILWTGHPAGLDDATVASMLDGTFDSSKAAAKQKAQEERATKMRALQTESAKLVKEKKYDEALKKIDELEAMLGGRSKSQMDYQRAMITGHMNVADGVAKMEKLVEDNQGNKGALTAFGSALLAPPFKDDKAAAKLALKCAERLRELTPGDARAEALHKRAAAAAGVVESTPAPSGEPVVITASAALDAKTAATTPAGSGSVSVSATAVPAEKPAATEAK